jgi:hypothetical protein
MSTNLNTSTGLLEVGDDAGRAVSARVAGTFATTAALKALAADRRIDGMLAATLADNRTWMFVAASSASAADGVLVPDAGTGRWLAVLPGAQVGAAQLAEATGNAASAVQIGAEFTIRKTFAALVTGQADDVTLYAAAAPFKFRILDVVAKVSAAVALSTLTLRTATGGGGSALSSDLSSATTGTKRDDATASATVAAAGSVYLRRSDRAVAGEVIITCVREA